MARRSSLVGELVMWATAMAGIAVICEALSMIAAWMWDHIWMIFSVVGLAGFIVAMVILVAKKVRALRNRERQKELDTRMREIAAAHVIDGTSYRRMVGSRLIEFDRVLIDANIWMTPAYHQNLELICLAAKGAEKPISLLGPEFEEMIRLRDSGNRQRAFRAREALRLIESLQLQHAIRIERVALSNIRRAFFDAAVQRLVEQELSQRRSVAIITDDAELPRRVRLWAACDRQAFWQSR